MQSYYARATASPDTARGRAQAAYGVASALAGGLLAATIVSRLSSIQFAVQIVGLVSITLWLVATSLYLHAIALPVKPVSDNVRQRGSTAFVDAVMSNAVNERVTVDRRQRRANVASMVAMVATLVTFALTVLLPREAFLATILLTPSPEATTACLRSPHTITGDVIASTMQSNLVEIRHATVCSDEIARIFVDSRRIIEVQVAE